MPKTFTTLFMLSFFLTLPGQADVILDPVSPTTDITAGSTGVLIGVFDDYASSKKDDLVRFVGIALQTTGDVELDNLSIYSLSTGMVLGELAGEPDSKNKINLDTWYRVPKGSFSAFGILADILPGSEGTIRAGFAVNKMGGFEWGPARTVSDPPVPTPEPSTIALAVPAMFCALLYNRRQRRL